MYSEPRLDLFKDFSGHGKILGDLATVLDEVDAGHHSKEIAAIGFEGAIPLKNYHQMIQALHDELHLPLAKETIPEDLDLFSIFKIPQLYSDPKFIPENYDVNLVESKIISQRRFVAGISRNYNNLLMGIQGNLSLILLGLENDHPYCPIIRSAEELVQSGSFAISLLLGYLAERRWQARRIRFNHLVAEVAARQTYIPTEQDRQHFEQWLLQVPKLEGLAYLAQKCTQSFNRLLRSIATWAEWIRLSGKVDIKISARLLKIRKLAETGYWISGKLMAFSSLGNFDLQSVALTDILDVFCEEFKRHHPDIQIRRFQRKPDVSLLADPGHLNQAMVELFQNAADSMPDGGRITLTVKKLTLPQRRSKWKSLKSGKYVMITVKDSGKGLDLRGGRKDIDKVFDPFFSTKSAGKRMGLGLSLVYGVARQLGGAVEIISDSGIGPGVQVRLILPILPSV